MIPFHSTSMDAGFESVPDVSEYMGPKFHPEEQIQHSKIQMYLYKFLNLFAQIAKYIRPN